MAGTVRNIRFTPENDAYLVENGDDNITRFVNGLIQLVRTGEYVPKPTETGKDKSLDQLEKEHLALKVKLKQQQADMHDLEINHRKLDLIIKELKAEKLRRELDRNPSAPRPAAPPVVASIQSEIAKDNAQPQPQKTRKQPNTVRELPPGQGLVGCDTCHEVFIFDNPDKGLDGFLDHLQKMHPFRHEQISHNEAVQFRYAKARIEKGVPA